MEGRDVGKIGEGDTEVQTSSCKVNKPCDVTYSMRNMVNDIVMTLYGDRWLLDLYSDQFTHMQSQITIYCTRS